MCQGVKRLVIILFSNRFFHNVWKNLFNFTTNYLLFDLKFKFFSIINIFIDHNFIIFNLIPNLHNFIIIILFINIDLIINRYLVY